MTDAELLSLLNTIQSQMPGLNNLLAALNPVGTAQAQAPQVQQQQQTVPDLGPAAGIPLGELPGTLHLLDQFNSIGKTRPFGPGEWLQNPDGGWSSEMTVTVPDPRNEANWMVVPSLWLVDGKPTHLSEDDAAELAVKSGLGFPTYPSEQAGTDYANAREAKWQNVPIGRSDLQPSLWTQPKKSNAGQ